MNMKTRTYDNFPILLGVGVGLLNYSPWARVIKAHLISEGLWANASGAKRRPVTFEDDWIDNDWYRADAKAKTILYGAMHDKIVYELCSMRDMDASEIWEWLEDRHNEGRW